MLHVFEQRENQRYLGYTSKYNSHIERQYDGNS